MTTQTNIATTVQTAIADAREWLMTDNGDDDRLTADLEAAVDAFDLAIDADDLEAALAECVSISQDWASGDTSGFSSLAAVVALIGQAVETDDGSGKIGYITSTEVTVAWEGGVSTTEPVQRLADWGFDLT